MYKTVPFQIFNGNAKNNSFQLVLTAFHSSFFFFFLKNRGVFFSRCEGRDHWFQRSSVPDGTQKCKTCSRLPELQKALL